MILHNRKLLAKLMRIQGISQRKLATTVGWSSHTFVARLVNGSVDSLSSDKALLIAYVLGVGVDDLFTTKVSTVANQFVSQRSAA